MQFLRTFVLIFSLFLPFSCIADSFEKQASYTVCFTPSENCTQKIVDAINNSVSNVWVQAYGFTSHPIGNALANAKSRGVNVQIILDKSHLKQSGTARFFSRHNIPVWIDRRPAIAHNKVMIIDQTQVITGSFNFTNAAQRTNAENLLIINDAGLAKKYLANWQTRQKVSAKLLIRNKQYANEQYGLVEESDWLEQLWRAILQWLAQFFK